jgi:hypothetical protein
MAEGLRFELAGNWAKSHITIIPLVLIRNMAQSVEKHFPAFRSRFQELPQIRNGDVGPRESIW